MRTRPATEATRGALGISGKKSVTVSFAYTHLIRSSKSRNIEGLAGVCMVIWRCFKTRRRCDFKDTTLEICEDPAAGRWRVFQLSKIRLFIRNWALSVLYTSLSRREQKRESLSESGYTEEVPKWPVE